MRYWWPNLDSWWWRIRYWWVFLPRIRQVYGAGYRMGWHESRLPGMELDEDAAFNDWASRLGDN